MTPLTLTKTPSSATGANYEAAIAAATPVMLYQDSHFTLYGKCLINQAFNELETEVFIATKQDGAIFDSDDDELSGEAPGGYLNVATPETEREVIGLHRRKRSQHAVRG
jgi:hypothetical protein